MRKDHWKLLCDYDGSEPQLYDLRNDKGETSNLATRHPAILKKLTSELVDWNKSMPSDNGS